MKRQHVFTIGFTQTTAEHFFDRLTAAGVKTVIDVRRNNTSQLAGFAKAGDLAYFLGRIGGIGYMHEPLLTPTEALMKFYKKDGGDKAVFSKRFLTLMAERGIERKLKPALFEHACLLCSEADPHDCHRKLVCDYLNGRWGGTLQVQHL